MFCPNLSDPKIKKQFQQLESAVPDLAHYLWNKYEGEVPAKYYNINNLKDIQGITKYSALDSESVKTLTREEAESVFSFLKAKTGLDGRIVEDSSLGYKGAIIDGKPVINIAYADLGDAFHEYFHPILMGIRLTNPKLFNNLYDQLQSLPEFEDIKTRATNKVRLYYPEYNKEDKERDFMEEVMVTALGYAAEIKSRERLDEINKNRGIFDWIKDLYKYLKEFLADYFTETVNLDSLSLDTKLSDILEWTMDTKTKINLVQETYSWTNENTLRDVEREFKVKVVEETSQNIIHNAFQSNKSNLSPDEYIVNWLNKNFKNKIRDYKPRQFDKNSFVYELAESLINSDSGTGYQVTNKPLKDFPDTVVQEVANALQKIDFTYKYATWLGKKGDTLISLSSPFKADGIGSLELDVLETFRSHLKDKYPSAKSLPANQLLNEYESWAQDNFQINVHDVSGYEGYGLNRLGNSSYQNYTRKLFLDDTIIQQGHSFTFNENLNGNGLGWYASVEFGGDLFHHEFQSDILPEVARSYKEGQYSGVVTAESLDARQKAESKLFDAVVKGFDRPIAHVLSSLRSHTEFFNDLSIPDSEFEDYIKRVSSVVDSEYEIAIRNLRNSRSARMLASGNFTHLKLANIITNLLANPESDKTVEFKDWLFKNLIIQTTNTPTRPKAIVDGQPIFDFGENFQYEDLPFSRVEYDGIFLYNSSLENDKIWKNYFLKPDALESVPTFLQKEINTHNGWVNSSKAIKPTDLFNIQDLGAALSFSNIHLFYNNEATDFINVWTKPKSYKNRKERIKKELKDLRQEYNKLDARNTGYNFRQKIYKDNDNLIKVVNFYRNEYRRYLKFYTDLLPEISDYISSKVGKSLSDLDPKYKKYSDLYKKWWDISIQHSINSAKSQGHLYYYLPTAKAMEAIEGNTIAAPLYRSSFEVAQATQRSVRDNVISYIQQNTQQVTSDIRYFLEQANLMSELTTESTAAEVADLLLDNTPFAEQSIFFGEYQSRFKVSTNVGPFFSTLSNFAKKNNIKLSYETPMWSKFPLIKVDLSGYDLKPISRFSKLERAYEEFANSSDDTQPLQVMESRVSVDELLGRYMRQEKTQDFIKQLRNDPEYNITDSFEKKLNFIASKVKSEVENYLDGLRSVTKVNDKYFVHTSKKVAKTKQVYSVAESIAKSINGKYLGLDKPIAYYYKGESGVYITLTNSPTAFEPLYDLVEELETEETRAEVEMLDRIEFMRAEKQALLEKQIEANEYLTEDGEVLPYNGALFFRHFELAKFLSKKEIKQYERLFNRLASKFPGVQWAWDTTIPQAGKIDFKSGLVLINPAFMNPELAFHEFGHILIRSIKQTNPALFESLKAEVEALHEMSPETSSVARVTDLYPDLIGTQEFWEEVITTELGRQASLVEKPNLFQRILQWFKSIFAEDNFVADENTTLEDLVQALIGNEELIDIYSISPETQEYMESRVMNQDLIDSMMQYVKTDPNSPDQFQSYKEQIGIISKAIRESEVKKIFDTNKFIGIGNESLKQSIRAISQIKDLVNEEDIAASVLDLADYLQYSSLYLQGLAAHLTKILSDDTIPQGKKLGDLHRAHKQAMAFKKHLQKIVGMFSPELTKLAFVNSRIGIAAINNNHFVKNVFWMNQTINGIEGLYNQNLINPVLAELGNSLEQQRKAIEKSFDDQIENLKKKRQTPQVLKQIADLELRKTKEVPTPENIREMLKDTTSPWYLAWDSSMYTKTPSVQLIAGYIKNINNEFLRNLQGISTEWQGLMDDIIAVEGAFTGSVIDVKDFYKPYYRETELVRIVNGKKERVPVLALNTPIKTVEIKNRITELNNLIQTAETPEKAAEYQDTLNKFYEDYTERPFTEEYYEIQKLLPEDIRKQRNQIFEDIAALREEFGMGEVNDEVLERLRLKEKELYDLERFYDDLGRRKTDKELEVAQAIQTWKDAKRAAATIQYELTDDAKLTFERTLLNRKEKLRKALAQAKTPKQREDAQRDYDTWASVYTRTIYTDEFYLEREAIINEIQDLLSFRDDSALSERYQNLFNLLRGNKDQNGEYLPTSLTADQTRTARNIELEIEAVKALLKENSPLSKDVKDRLVVLVKELQNIQSSVNSTHYENAVESLKAEIRTQIFQQNPNLSEDSIEELVHRAFLESEWYKENHITKNRWDDQQEQIVEVEEPIYMWRVTKPRNPAYIQNEAPSFLWYKTKISDEFKNPLYKPGEVTFKQITGGEYYNTNFDSLRPEQKNIMLRMQDLHYKSQQNLYQSDKLGDIVPGMFKTNAEIVLDIKSGKNPFKRYWQQIKSWFAGDREAFDEDEDLIGNPNQTDAFGDPVVRESRRLFNRYARVIERDKQSYNIMVAMASYATSSERFKVMRKYQASVLAMEEVVRMNQGNSGARKTIGDLIDRELYGKYANKNLAGSILRATTKFAGFKTLGFNIISLPQNWISGMLSVYAQAGFYGIRRRDILKAQVETIGLAKEFYLHYNKFGNKPMKLALVDYFVGTQNQSNQASEIDNKGITKYGKVWKTVHTMRDFTEFDIAATTTYAFLNKYRVNLIGSTNTIPLKDAFELKDGVIQPRPDVEINEDFIQLVRNQIQLANERAQGNYLDVAQPTASRNAFYKMALFLKKWVIPQLKSTWGSETIHYHSGIRTIGSHRAMVNFLGESIMDPSNFINNWKYASDFQKAGLKQFMFQYSTYAVFANLLMQMSLRLECEEDGEEDWKDYVCLTLKRTANEAEGVFTMWGLGELWFTFAKEQANGVGVFEKVGWQLAGPISVYRKFFTDEALYSSDPYYKYRANSTKIDWDKTHPMIAGKSGLSVLGLEILGARGIGIGPKSIAYQNRAFNNYSPKTYTKELRTRYKKDHEGLETMPTRLPMAQLVKQYKKEVKEIQKKIAAYKQNGEPVPQSLYDRLDKIRNNFQQSREDLNAGKTEDARGLYLPLSIFSSREGLDMNPGEIEEMDFGDTEED
jgi:hypothetical protein